MLNKMAIAYLAMEFLRETVNSASDNCGAVGRGAVSLCAAIGRKRLAEAELIAHRGP
jgi:hypothetical protein